MHQAQKTPVPTYEIEGVGFSQDETVVVVGGGEEAESVQDYIACSGKVIGVTNTRPRWFLLLLDDHRQITARPHHIESLRTVHGARLHLYRQTLEQFFYSNDFPAYVRAAGQEGHLNKAFYLMLYSNGTWAGLKENQMDSGDSGLALLLWDPKEPHLSGLKDYLRDRLRHHFETRTSSCS